MPTIHQRIANCLWFDFEAEEAAQFYTSIFPNSSIGDITHYGKEGFEHHHQPEGKVLTVTFKLDGIQYMALNGGPLFPFTEAISLMVYCKDQEEVDYYWDHLTEGGKEVECGWLKDKYGLSWQVVPIRLMEMMADPDQSRVDRVTKAYLGMRKFDVAMLEKAYHQKD